MRIAPVLSTRDLPQAELQAGVLDGELVRVGEGFCAIDTIISSLHRAASIAAEVPAWAIAERHTAAWIYGILVTQPRQLSLCVTSAGNVRPFSSHRYAFREVVLGNDDIVVIGGMSVTTPLRTAIDIVRIEEDFQEEGLHLVRKLACFGQGFTLDDCVKELASRRNLPHKRKALQRLTAALAHRREDQPAFTR